MKTTESLIRIDKDVLDPRTNEPMKIVLWPTTKQLKEIPIPLHFHEGYLDKMEFWVYDEATTTAVIKFKEGVLRLSDIKDLLRFNGRDIHTWADHQIICKSEIMEAAAKEFTGMVAKIIDKRLWIGAMGKSDVMFLEKLR